MKLAILLPYKENFTHDLAGAVSLFVSQVTKVSKYKNNILIYGNTKSKNYLTNNYKNITFKKSIFQSASKNYVDSFLKIKSVLASDIIEVHNRPSYVKYIKKKIEKKIFLFFHNDPLTMEDSSSVEDRIYLINNTNKLFFNSKWSKRRFFLDIPEKLINSNQVVICYQSSNKVKINFNKKEKILSFIGKLNSSKGYDIFGEVIIDMASAHACGFRNFRHSCAMVALTSKTISRGTEHLITSCFGKSRVIVSFRFLRHGFSKLY